MLKYAAENEHCFVPIKKIEQTNVHRSLACENLKWHLIRVVPFLFSVIRGPTLVCFSTYLHDLDLVIR